MLLASSENDPGFSSNNNGGITPGRRQINTAGFETVQGLRNNTMKEVRSPGSANMENFNDTADSGRLHKNQRSMEDT